MLVIIILRSHRKFWLWIPRICRENVIHNPNFIRKLLSLTRNKVLVTGKILLVHIRWMLITKVGTGNTYCLKGKDINFVLQEKYIFWKISSRDRNNFLWQEICYCDKKLLPVTENVFLWEEIFLLYRANFILWEQDSSYVRKLLSVTGIFFLWQEISSKDRIFLPVAQKVLCTISFWGRNIILVEGTFCNILFHLILQKLRKNHTHLS